jgi:hypothetical protein
VRSENIDSGKEKIHDTGSEGGAPGATGILAACAAW